jgi:hypothetical protein
MISSGSLSKSPLMFVFCSVATLGKQWRQEKEIRQTGVNQGRREGVKPRGLNGINVGGVNGGVVVYKRHVARCTSEQ